MNTTFSEIQIGEFFSNSDGTYQRIYARLVDDPSWRVGWAFRQNAIAVNVETGGFASFGPAAPVTRAQRPDNPRREMIMADEVRLVSRTYEFGVGGISHADDQYYAASQYQPTGEVKPKLAGKGPARHNGGGQLWEPCPVCGDEPVHLDCGYCGQHCQC